MESKQTPTYTSNTKKEFSYYSNEWASRWTTVSKKPRFSQVEYNSSWMNTKIEKTNNTVSAAGIEKPNLYKKQPMKPPSTIHQVKLSGLFFQNSNCNQNNLKNYKKFCDTCVKQKRVII